jgi:hypothetical protein
MEKVLIFIFKIWQFLGRKICNNGIMYKSGGIFMIDSYLRELRNIRVTLVILTIIIAFTSGNRSVTVEDRSESNWPQFQYSNMVPLDNGHFGVLSGDSQAGDSEYFKIYYYDAEQNEMILKKEMPLSEIFNKEIQ